MEMKLPAYQQILFKNEDDNVFKSADIQRKCLVHLVQASCVSLENSTTCQLLQNKLEKYSKTVHNNGENIYTNRLRSLLEKTEKVPKPENFRSSLESFDSTNLLAPLPCTQTGSKCAVSEKFSEDEFQEFYETLSKNRPLSKSVFIPQLSGSSIYARSEQISSDTFRERNNVRYPESNNKNLLFKTARDELQQQNTKKYGNSYAPQQNPQLNNMGQKRKLGTRRNINSKFVSPLLTTNDSNEDMKSDEWSTETEERYKNVEPKMIELIKSEIMDCGPNIHWNDIAGLEFAKTAIQEAVVWPMLRPDIFTGLRRPPKGILLFGPPGTGKTLIGKCVASQSKSTFFSISASSLTSKWVGDGEKMVRALFVVARVHQPSVIFIDEIDSLLSQRSDTEHESSRRIKTEFLVQLDGATTDSEERILVIGATNRPQELDEAARRRFVKRLYIPLPEFDARLQLVYKLIANEKHLLTEENFKEIAQSSEGYSGADIRNLCSEASLGPIRSIDMSLIEHISASQVRPLQKEDFDKAFFRVRSSVSPKDLEQYITWDKTYGSGSGF